jgi:hypothetical protein
MDKRKGARARLFPHFVTAVSCERGCETNDSGIGTSRWATNQGKNAVKLFTILYPKSPSVYAAVHLHYTRCINMLLLPIGVFYLKFSIFITALNPSAFRPLRERRLQ